MKEDLNCLPAFDLKLSSLISSNTTFSEKVERILKNTLSLFFVTTTLKISWHQLASLKNTSVGIPHMFAKHIAGVAPGRGREFSKNGKGAKNLGKKLVGPMFHWQKIDLLWPGSCFPSLCGALELLQRACRLLTNDFNLFSAANQSL